MAERDKARQAILMRRRAFVTAALAGAGVAVAGCDDCGPQTCLEPDVHSSQPCLTIAPLPPDAGTVTSDGGAQGDAAAAPSDAGELPDAVAPPDDAATSTTGPDASSALVDKPKPPPPKPCLGPPRPCLQPPRPRVCLTPKRPDKPPSKL